MLNLFKSFGKGILYVLVLPFLLVGLALYGVVAIFIFIFLAIKGLVLFFTGRSLYEDLPEDKEAKKRIAIANGTYVEEESEPEQEEQNEEPIQEESKEDDVDTDPFYVPHYLRDEVQVEEKKETILEESEEGKLLFEEPDSQAEQDVEETINNEEIPSKRSQNSAFSEIESDDERDSDDSGITINYE